MGHKVSIVVPIHDMENGDFFLWRLINSLTSQTFKDYELIITKEGRMAENTNAGIKRATGEIVKILYLDDFFAHPDALKNIVDAFTPETKWLVTGCLHQEEGQEVGRPHYPVFTYDLSTGNNRIGGPSVLAFRNEGHLLFDEQLSWLLDCDLYERYYDKYGTPTVLNDLNVVMGLGKHQTTHILTDEEKMSEHIYLSKKEQ